MGRPRAPRYLEITQAHAYWDSTTTSKLQPAAPDNRSKKCAVFHSRAAAQADLTVSNVLIAICKCNASVEEKGREGRIFPQSSLRSEKASRKGRGRLEVPLSLTFIVKWLLSKMTLFFPSTHPSSWPWRMWQTPSSTGQQSNARRSTRTAINQLHRRLQVAESDFIRSSGPCRRSCCTRRSRGSTLSAPITPKTGTLLTDKFETHSCSHFFRPGLSANRCSHYTSSTFIGSGC